MNSLGAGGALKPYLVNTSNALTFCLMVVTCYSSAMTKYIGIKGALVFGILGYAPYAAGLSTNNRFGTEWLVLFGAALCGISAGVLWASEAAIAIAYPEPKNKGKVLGYWLTYRLGGQILGGAINLGLNAKADKAGKVSYVVYLVSIALQCCGPLVALFFTPAEKVERTDGKNVDMRILENPWTELGMMAKTFFNKKFLLLILFIGQAVYAEAVYFTYLSLWLTVRSRALRSFLSGIVAVAAGNILGAFLDRTKIPLHRRSRIAFGTIVTLQGAWWLWITVLATRFHNAADPRVYDWSSSGFGSAFAVFVFLTMGFQLNYLFWYLLMSQLAENEMEVIRYAALLRSTESAWQAVSYGLNSIPIMASVGGIYVNFGLWAAAIGPAWLVIRHFGR